MFVYVYGGLVDGNLIRFRIQLCRIYGMVYFSPH